MHQIQHCYDFHLNHAYQPIINAPYSACMPGLFGMFIAVIILLPDKENHTFVL